MEYHAQLADLKTVIAAIYSNFTTSVVDSSGIEQEDTFVAGPVSKSLMLRFKDVDMEK